MAIRLVKGEDQPVARGVDLTVIKTLRAYKKEAHQARITRLAKNRLNRQVFMGEQDYSEKRPGQSTEFIPKLGIAAEQLTNFVKKALTNFGNYFDVEMNGERMPILEEEFRKLIMFYFNDLPGEDGKSTSFQDILGDAVKTGSLESLMTFKVHGHQVNKRGYLVEEGENGKELVVNDNSVWRPRIDIVPDTSYLPDPKGEGLYEIHTVERDISHLEMMAEDGIYDPDVVAKIRESFEEEEYNFKRRPVERGQDESKGPEFRKRVVIDECWGNLLDNDGRIIKKNMLTAVANDKYLIRPPEDNPFWHGKSPFVSRPLVRVPFSVWHKAVFDHAASLNIALNEIFNLMLDGALATVWGIKQVRAYGLENDEQISDGLSQGMSLIVREDFPMDGKVVEDLTQGQVPPEALTMFQVVSDNLSESAFANELKFGQIPSNVKATTVLEASKSQDAILDGVAAGIEYATAEVIQLTALNIMQHAEDLDDEKVMNAVGKRTALLLSRLTPEERFAAFAGNMDFKVFGVSTLLARSRNFQKFAALLQVASSNPVLLSALFKRYDPNKMLDFMFKAIDIDPKDIEREEVTIERLVTEYQDAALFAGMTGGGASQPAIADQESAQTPAEINQLSNPLTGLGGQ